MKSKGTAYLLWLISIFGWLGFQHFYLGKIFKGIIWILTGGVFGIGSLIDLFTLGGQVENYNTKKELKIIRAATLSNLASQKNRIVEEQKKRLQEETQKQIIETINPKAPKQKKESSLLPVLNYVTANKKTILQIALSSLLILVVAIVVVNFIEPDFSDPKNVVEEEWKLWTKGNLKRHWKYLSKNTQATYNSSVDEYIKLRSVPDSILKKYELVSITANELPNMGYEIFKRFEAKSVYKDNRLDTVTNITTIINENGKWKIIDNRALSEKANEESQKGNFRKSAELYNEAIKLNPFSINARTSMVWCYLRDTERPEYWEDSIVYQLNFALKLDSTNGSVFSAIGAYYSDRNDYKKAVDNFLYAAEYYKDSSSIANSYSNVAQNAKNYNVSLAEESLEKSIAYNEKSRFAWQTFGDLLYSNQKYSKAKEKYYRAIELVNEDTNMDNHTLISLYGQYALTCRKIGLKKEAEEYVLKCIRVYPDKKHPIFEELNL
jgi:tetratricopeptide (TPR) repeat protein